MVADGVYKSGTSRDSKEIQCTWDRQILHTVNLIEHMYPCNLHSKATAQILVQTILRK